MLIWASAALNIVAIVVPLAVLWILLRIGAELRSLRHTVRHQLPILLRIHRLVVGTQELVNVRGLEPGVSLPEFAGEVPLSPSGQWPSLVSQAEAEFPSAEETSL